MKDNYIEVLTDLEKHSEKTPTTFSAIALLKEQRAEIADEKAKGKMYNEVIKRLEKEKRSLTKDINELLQDKSKLLKSLDEKCEWCIAKERTRDKTAVNHPIDIGSTLYVIWRSHTYVITKCTVKAIIYDQEGWRVIYRFENGKKSRVCFPSDVGKTVFKTFEEANKELQQYLKNKKN